MMLARIVPEGLGEDRHTFECPMCEHTESVVVKFDAEPQTNGVSGQSINS
jgi:hypothetical protein